MDRTQLVRRVAPVAVFAAVLGTLVLVSRRSSDTGGAPRPLPVAAGGGGTAAGASERRDAAMPLKSGVGITIPDRLLGGLPTEAPAYEAKRDGSDRVAALARALGVAGEVRRDGDGWVVGTDPKRKLHVSDTGGLPWYLYTDVKERYAAEATDQPLRTAPVVGPASDQPAGTDGNTGTDGGDTPTAAPATANDTPRTPSCPSAPPGAEPYCTVQPDPAPPSCPPDPKTGTADCPVEQPPAPPSPAPQPSDAEARAVLDKVLAAAGIEAPTVTLRPEFFGKEAVASPVVGGLPTAGFETRLTVDADGVVVTGNGYLGSTAKEATYPLLDPRKAAERMAGAGFGQPEPYAPCPPDQPCRDIAQPQPREVEALRLGLYYQQAYDGSRDAFLVPAWLLTFEDSDYEEPLMALPDAYVAEPAAPSSDPDEPVCNPEPCGKPVDGGTGSTGTGSTDPGSGSGWTGYSGAPEPEPAKS